MHARRQWGYLLAAVATEVAGSLSLKGALTHPALYAVVALAYTLAFWCLSRTLRLGMPIGVAYGVWAALGVALTTVMSAALFGEPVSLVTAAGIALVMGGVLLVEIGSQHAQERAAARDAAREGAAA